MSVQLELLVPAEIRSALKAHSIVYLPFGTIEWHGEHLPVGLDSLTAHAICIGAAERGGGLVYPPFYYGTGGGHADYDWTVMIEPEQLKPIVLTALTRLQAFNVQQAVLFSGHFALEHTQLMQTIAADWSAAGNTMRVKALSVAVIPGLPYAPDHAAIFETTLMQAIRPPSVQLTRLPPLDHTAEEPNPMGPQRHAATHPLRGIFGPDPRRLEPDFATPMLNTMIAWLADEVRR